MCFINNKPLSLLPSVAVVILNWNGRAFLEKFLPSVLASMYDPLTVYVADNASTDDSVLFLQQHFPQVKILVNSENEGFAKGYNTALRQVEASYYVILNSDVEVDPNWITPVITMMERDKNIAACQPKIISYKNKDAFEYAGASGGFIDRLGYPFSRGRVFDHCEKDNGQYDQPMPVFWATGAAMFVRSSVFHEAGGFDEYFFAHQEEIDLCWRMQRMGYTVYAQPTSVVYHVGGGTLSADDPKKSFLNFRNNLVMLSKNLPFKESIWKIPFRIGLDLIAALQQLLKGNFKASGSVIRAHLAFYQWLFIKKQTTVFSKIKMNQLKGVYKGSIVYDYFIRGKKTFSEIVINNNEF